ncbi:MAG: group II intron reverse transcriptase/maturase, partial [Nitrososphaera sp.]|nr:group II intron reverse transcriptase/maturase [Nitrososphaera sp.]
MEMERRASVIPSQYFETTLKEDDDKRNDKVTLPISKRMVYNSYLKVVANAGSAGIDQQSIEQFNESMSGKLYKTLEPHDLWQLFSPAGANGIDSLGKQGGTRPLGIPTVSYRTC